MSGDKLNIGFISFRFAGTDGVSLETSKWAQVFEEMGHTCFYFSGESDRPEHCSVVLEEAHFQHPETMSRHESFRSSRERTHDDSLWIEDRRQFFYRHVKRFIRDFELDLLIPENLFCYPLNIPLTLAVTDVIAETLIPAIAHHHDFYWERKAFLVNAVWDYLTMAFPPTLPPIRHVVINSSARHQLAARRGLASIIIPNVMDFETPAPEPDEYSSDVRDAIGLDEDELLILQPTRVKQRKGIEHAIELVSRLGRKARLVITHAVTDDNEGYFKRVQEYAAMLKVNALFTAELFDENRRIGKDGSKVYSLNDVYPFADLVTYPSLFEGFGNAFLETIYFRKPIVVNNYTIYESDIRSKGFRVIYFRDFITDATVQQALDVLDHPDTARSDCDINYDLALKYYSYKTLRSRLSVLLDDIYGMGD